MTTREIISAYLNAITEGIKEDAASKNQKIPVSSFQVEATDTQGQLYAAHYFKYLVLGRAPGKQPPPDAMLKFVQSNPQILEEARRVNKYITERGLAFLIGRKIGREGTDIFQGKKPGIDLQGAVDTASENFLAQLAYHEAVNVGDKITQAA